MFLILYTDIYKYVPAGQWIPAFAGMTRVRVGAGDGWGDSKLLKPCVVMGK